jgi:AcrR family transcriptional regulator
MSTTTRQRILEAGASLFQLQGYSGSGMKQIAAQASAPFGSIYHFFPGGKDELSAEVIRTAGRTYGQLLPMVFDAEPDVAQATRNFFLGAAEALRASGYQDACPIATVALEVASVNEPLRVATAEVFESWIEALAARFARAALPEPRPRELAVAMIAILEGAFVLGRAMRDARHVEIAGEMMSAAVRQALADAALSGPAGG